MSKLCFSYPAGMPEGLPGRSAARAAQRDLRRMPYPGYSYPIMCFRYPDDGPRGGRSDLAQPSPPGPRAMPMTCFRY
jgi:hypothetical protein